MQSDLQASTIAGMKTRTPIPWWVTLARATFYALAFLIVDVVRKGHRDIGLPLSLLILTLVGGATWTVFNTKD